MTIKFSDIKFRLFYHFFVASCNNWAFLSSIIYIFDTMDIGAIVKDCQNGSREAFGFLYQTYSLPMMGVIGYYVHNQEIVKDILH